MTKDIYEMKLNEILKIHDCLWIIRVPGGWIYTFGASELQPLFVPFSDEFQDKFKGAL